jgi:hypothetical protein
MKLAVTNSDGLQLTGVRVELVQGSHWLRVKRRLAGVIADTVGICRWLVARLPAFQRVFG